MESSIVFEQLSIPLIAIVAALLIATLTLRRSGSKRGIRQRGSPFLERGFRVLGVILLTIAFLSPVYQEVSSSSSILLLADLSDSMEEGAVQPLLEQAAKFKNNDRIVEILPFARETASFVSEFETSSFSRLRQSWEKLDIGGTDMESAFRSIGKGASVLLISDGHETAGDLSSALPVLSQQGVKIFPLVPESGSASSEHFRLSTLHAPLVAPAEKSVEIRAAVLNATKEKRSGRLEIKHDGKVLFDKEVDISPGKEALFSAQSDPSKEGIKEVSALFTPSDKGLPSSSQSIFISGEKREKVLLLNGSREDQELLRSTLAEQAYQLESLIPPFNLPSDLGDFSTIILNNVPKEDLPSLFPGKLEQFAKNGGSFIMIGGNRSFGLGGYLDSPIEKALPVEIVPPQTQKKRLNVAVVLVLDKSKSMASDSKINFARLAAAAVVKNLKDDDYIQIIGFDSSPFIVIPLKQLREIRDTALDRVNRLYPAGQTNLLPALGEAHRSLMNAQVGRKHVIVLTDGRLPSGEEYYMDRVRKMSAEGVTLSTVMIGPEPDTRLLESMARQGGGAFHRTLDPTTLPKIFLDDIKVSTGERTLKENQEYLVRAGTAEIKSTSIRAFPPLLGYVQTKPKNGSNLELVVFQDDKAEPLLASWKYGQGKVKAFTSDANARWSRYWASWPRFSEFWSDQIDDLRPQKESHNIKFDLRHYVERGSLILDLALFSEEFDYTPQGEVILPGGKSVPVSFTGVSRGRYIATIPQVGAGRHELRTTVSGKPLTPVAFSISGELFGEKKGRGFNLPFLSKIASATGGQVNPRPDTLQGETQKEEKKTDLAWPFVVLGLLALLAEILVREGALRLPSLALKRLTLKPKLSAGR